MEANVSAVPIEPKQLEQFSERANRLLSGVKWAAKPDMFSKAKGPAVSSTPVWRESGLADASQIEEMSLLHIARGLNPNCALLSEDLTHVLQVVWQALRIGMHLSKTYTRFSGLDQLIALNSRGGLVDSQKAEFRSKYQSASAITIFVVAYYIVWELETFKEDKTEGVQLEFLGVPEISLQDPVHAVDCMLYYYGAYLEKSGGVRSDLEFLKMTLLYFRAVVDEVKLRESSLQHTEPFTSQIYKLQESEFAVRGFEVDYRGTDVSIEFNRVELSEIVGNRDAKHEARRLAARLMCYDLTTQRNPFVELGGLAPVSMGYGEPGTGKSMLISALATLLHDYCKALGVPFLFWPMPDTVVSTYQGGSAERMMNWMRVLRDPAKIIYAPIDDAENNLEDRTRQGVSAGVREVIAVFLRNTEGAYALNRGNALIQLFTNLPDQIDKAVLSRINSRAYIGGAKTFEDFVDQDYLWLRKHREISADFVDMQDPSDYVYLKAQANLTALGEIAALSAIPQHERARMLFEETSKKYGPQQHAFYAEFFMRLKQEFPSFTSRDVRNIQRAVDARIMDFELPEEWLSNPEVFHCQPYQNKKAMLIELMRANMRGLSLADIRIQEVVRYVDNMLRIAEGGKERKIGELVGELEIQREAQRRLANGASN